MHPVDGRELLAQPEVGERRLRVAEDPAELPVGDRDLLEGLLPLAAEQARDEPVPVGEHAVVQRAVREDRGRPLDGVDLRHHRRVDQPGRLEQRLVTPVGMMGLERVADRVVLAHEQGVDGAQGHPPVAREASGLGARVGIDRQQALVGDRELSVDPAADLRLRAPIAAVKLRPVPPMRDLVDERRRAIAIGGLPRRILGRRPHVEVVDAVARAQRIVGGEGQGLRAGRVRRAVADPVVVHELDPHGGPEVQERHQLALAGGREEREAQLAHVHGARRRVGPRANGVEAALVADVAEEARVGRADHGVEATIALAAHFVPTPVGRAPPARVIRRFLGRPVERGLGSVRIGAHEVVGEQRLAHVGELEDLDELGGGRR